MLRLIFVLIAFQATGLADVRTGQFQQRDAFTLDTPALRVTILASGGHIGEIARKEPGGVNPLWIQKRPTIDLEGYDPARHEKFYGGGIGARLMSGLMGHNLCFPFWGHPSESEARAGMTFHGETGIVRWKLAGSGSDWMTITADMPESRTRFERKVRIAGGIVYFDNTAENVAAWDRPVAWCEHVTLGPPFLQKGVTTIDASLTRGRVNADTSGREFTWPEGMAEVKIDLRRVRDIERSGFVNNFLVDPAREHAFFAAAHPGLKLVFGYVFRRAEFPWLNVWEANNPDMLTRGMEFSNTPTHGTLKSLLQTAQLYGTPTYEWLDARSKLRKRFAAFSAPIGAGYKGVADVRIRSGKLEIVERETGRTISLDFSASW